MDYESYRARNFVVPAPPVRFGFVGVQGVTLYFEDYERAVGYYSAVLGPPTYVEGDSTRGWPVGDTWLTLLRGKAGSPGNVEVAFVMQSREEVARLQQAFVEAGGTGEPPSEQLMYWPVYICPVRDPFGAQIAIYCRLE